MNDRNKKYCVIVPLSTATSIYAQCNMEIFIFAQQNSMYQQCNTLALNAFYTYTHKHTHKYKWQWLNNRSIAGTGLVSFFRKAALVGITGHRGLQFIKIAITDQVFEQ